MTFVHHDVLFLPCFIIVELVFSFNVFCAFTLFYLVLLLRSCFGFACLGVPFLFILVFCGFVSVDISVSLVVFRWS